MPSAALARRKPLLFHLATSSARQAKGGRLPRVPPSPWANGGIREAGATRRALSSHQDSARALAARRLKDVRITHDAVNTAHAAKRAEEAGRHGRPEEGHGARDGQRRSPAGKTATPTMPRSTIPSHDSSLRRWSAVLAPVRNGQSSSVRDRATGRRLVARDRPASKPGRNRRSAKYRAHRPSHNRRSLPTARSRPVRLAKKRRPPADR